MENNKYILGGLLLVFSLVCKSAVSVDLIIDQACDNMGMIGYGAEKNQWDWQEFRPTMDNLEQVDLYLLTAGAPSNATVSFQVSDGGTILWSTSFSINLIGGGWFEIDTPHIQLVPDHSYLLCLTSNLTYEQVMNGMVLLWSAVQNNPYTRGKSVFDYYYGTNDDFMFRTWAVPEPATLLLLGLGGLFLRRK